MTSKAFVIPVLALIASGTASHARSDEPAAPPPPKDAGAWQLSDQTFRVRYLQAAAIRVDGRADEPAWSEAVVERQFRFPWKPEPAPATEFRAVCDERHLSFTFRVHDTDIVVLDTLRDKQDAVLEDRVEMFFAPDERLSTYYCFEIDSRGRAFDYSGSYYRRFDPRWSFPGLETAATAIDQGYVVEGRIPLASLEQLGFPRLRPGVTIRCGLYRAEFSHDRSGRPAERKETIHNRGRTFAGPAPIENWISWVDPQTPEPDFHVPSSLGRLEVME
jgi:hypothetical protein